MREAQRILRKADQADPISLWARPTYVPFYSTVPRLVQCVSYCSDALVKVWKLLFPDMLNMFFQKNKICVELLILQE